VVSYTRELQRCSAALAKDSLERSWGATAQSSAFLDLRKVAPGRGWLDQPVVTNLFNGKTMPLYTRTFFDAAFFIRTMRRSTR